MDTKTTHIYKDNPAVAAAFAEWLVDWLKGRQRTTIALSGGSTPKLLFQLLAENYANQIDWSGIHLFWGDERCVAPNHADSNYGMTKALLLDHIDIPANNVHRIRGEEAPAAEAQRYGQEIQSVVSAVDGRPAFDLILLGMGGDGHTASIFPHEMHLLEEKEICGVATHPESGQNRITINGPIINHAYLISFLVTGSSKAEKVKIILEKQAGYEAFPAAHVHPKDGITHWFMDEAAAALLS
ncbi:MAG: 6-phosphogluconolactonase [Saprospiraceae bacterium]|nr:6-phosphogluconolactonase [Saprospiraceae bacterium]